MNARHRHVLRDIGGLPKHGNRYRPKRHRRGLLVRGRKRYGSEPEEFMACVQ